MHIPDNCATTQADGSYRLVLADLIRNCPTAWAQDFQTRQDCVILRRPETVWSPTLQRSIRIDAGKSVVSTILDDDISGFQFEDYCVRCKRIGILAVRAGRVTVRLTPENAGLRVAFGYSAQQLNEPFPVQAGQELPVTVLTESPSASRSFELSTVFVSD